MQPEETERGIGTAVARAEALLEWMHRHMKGGDPVQ
jgi:hypothetical protein